MNKFLNDELKYYTAMYNVASGSVKAYFGKMIQITAMEIASYAIHGE